MSSEVIYRTLIIFIFTSAGLSFILLVFVKAPYGRYVRRGWGPSIPARWAWIVMEAPAIAVILCFYLSAGQRDPLPVFFLLLWQLHYFYRTFLYPLLMRGEKKPFPLVLILMALVFNGTNGYVNGWFLFRGGRPYPASWLTDPRFIAGLALFLAGLYIHIRSDHILRRLREPGESCYKIPAGGMHRFLSAPNYFGEILQWFGWALATWSPAGLAFAVFTLANLLPRGISHHRWYRKTFPHYPQERKAVIPFLL